MKFSNFSGIYFLFVSLKFFLLWWVVDIIDYCYVLFIRVAFLFLGVIWKFKLVLDSWSFLVVLKFVPKCLRLSKPSSFLMRRCWLESPGLNPKESDVLFKSNFLDCFKVVLVSLNSLEAPYIFSYLSFKSFPQLVFVIEKSFD